MLGKQAGACVGLAVARALLGSGGYVREFFQDGQFAYLGDTDYSGSTSGAQTAIISDALLSFAKSLGIVSIVAPSQHAHNWRGQAGAHDLDMVSVSRLSDFLGFADEPVVDYNDDDSDHEGYLTDTRTRTTRTPPR